LIRKHNPDWHMHGGTGLHPNELADMALAGFTGLETFSYDVEVPYSHEAWRGRIRASAGIAATLSPKQVEAFDKDHQHLLEQNFPQDPLVVPHRVFAAIGWKKA
ncbi:MAG: SAM-dependent methyltransferase, partial [Alphaproteobacteria bacterium]|nr:SAM-dependent methyltransferase [Alphaproteobacteria bacterium]